ncbi:hypothetical protein CERZMDRAFT_82463 [Cercospora zeae-maydis SCOH1-5]|uniref:Uncharacterized protein n=1 Tax=Cercospora zeae-maydis SCOH1-5 TaxID=717836 RepID=A0A6A6FPS9_9PEZI|nr:hypothetical protein CERZMDRAFT_82463 [Cercospora zeae-maydis SCOH1-5]
MSAGHSREMILSTFEAKFLPRIIKLLRNQNVTPRECLLGLRLCKVLDQAATSHDLIWETMNLTTPIQVEGQQAIVSVAHAGARLRETCTDHAIRWIAFKLATKGPAVTVYRLWKPQWKQDIDEIERILLTWPPSGRSTFEFLAEKLGALAGEFDQQEGSLSIDEMSPEERALLFPALRAEIGSSVDPEELTYRVPEERAGDGEREEEAEASSSSNR